MNDTIVASELAKVAREMTAIDFPNKEEYNKYLKDHPDADRSNHRIVEKKKQPVKKQPVKEKEETEQEREELQERRYKLVDEKYEEKARSELAPMNIIDSFRSRDSSSYNSSHDSYSRPLFLCYHMWMSRHGSLRWMFTTS